MRAITFLLAVKYNNKDQTIIFDESIHELENLVRLNCGTNLVYVICFTGSSYTKGHWIGVKFDQSSKFIHYCHTLQNLVPVSVIEDKIEFVSYCYMLDFDKRENLLFHFLRSSTNVYDAWKVYEKQCNLTSNYNCGPFAILAINQLLCSSSSYNPRTFLFGDSIKASFSTFELLCSCLCEFHNNKLFGIHSSLKHHADYLLSKRLCQLSFNVIKNNIECTTCLTYDTCVIYDYNSLNKVNVAFNCCNCRLCFKCYKENSESNLTETNDSKYQNIDPYIHIPGK